MVRAALALLVVAGAVWVGMHVPHHANPDVFQSLFMHLVPAPIQFGHEPLGIALPSFLHAFTLDSSGHRTGVLVLTNLQVFQLAAVLLVAICFSGVAGHLRTGRGDAVSRLFSGFALWVRDEMVVPVMGRETGDKYLPYFLWVFFFILFMNLLGLIPGGATATSSIFVTAALATATLVAMVACGMVVQGPVAFWKNLVPHVPLALWPIMFVIEVVGLVIKPVALTIRLFANMTGGHMIVLSCMGLIMFFAARGAHATTGWLSAPLAVGFGVFIMIIESFVALLQAYIFTMLSVLFVNTSIHPEH
jgi:F-type H+-transporting ATPase subunit a